MYGTKWEMNNKDSIFGRIEAALNGSGLTQSGLCEFSMTLREVRLIECFRILAEDKKNDIERIINQLVALQKFENEQE